MRGRPPVAGLRAVVVAMMLAALPSGAVLAEQIRPNLPGAGAKPKAVHKARRFRPTLPQRNPTRVSADITATIKVDGTSSPLSADGAAASGMAGASASASVAVAGADIPQQRPIEVAAAEPASEPEITAALSPADAEPVEDSADDAGEDQAGAESDDTPSDETEEVAATETTAAAAEGEPAEKTSALADSAPSDETPPESADAGEEPASEAGKPEPVNATASEDETPEETDALAKPADVVADAGDAEASADDAAADEADEPSPPKETARLEAEPSPPKEIARLEAEPEQAKPEAAEPEEAKPEETKPEPAADAVEAEQSAEPEPEPEAEPEVVEAEPVETVVPSHDAIVVLEVLPPPADIAAAPAPAKPEAPADDAAPMEMAAVTPPSEPAPEPAIPAVNDTPADADAEDVPSEAAVDSDEAELTEPTEAAETSPAETSPDATLPDATPPAETASEPASGDAAATPATPEEDAAAPSDAAVEDAAVEVVPPPPPAHPVVAAIRAKLADPGFRDGFNAATLEGLEAFYGAREGPPLWITDSGFSPKAKALIAEIGNADDWGLDARDFDAPKADARASTEEEQAVAELDLAMAVLKYARYAQGGARSPSSFSPLFDQKPEQRGTETLLTEIAGASDPATYLTSLHPQHEQFKRLRAALVKARDRAAATGRNPRNDGEVQLLVINMERWRWLPRNLGSYHVWNNVPEFNVRVMKNGKPIYVEKTIVGQDKYATPFFSAPMRNIVFHPNWTVPPTIVKEDLAPKLQAPAWHIQPVEDGYVAGLWPQRQLQGRTGRRRPRRLGERQHPHLHFHPGPGPDQRARQVQVQLPQPPRHLHARHSAARTVLRAGAHPQSRLYPRARARPLRRPASRPGQGLVLCANPAARRQELEHGDRAEPQGARASHLFHRHYRREWRAEPVRRHLRHRQPHGREAVREPGKVPGPVNAGSGRAIQGSGPVSPAPRRWRRLGRSHLRSFWELTEGASRAGSNLRRAGLDRREDRPGEMRE